MRHRFVIFALALCFVMASSALMGIHAKDEIDWDYHSCTHEIGCVAGGITACRDLGHTGDCLVFAGGFLICTPNNNFNCNIMGMTSFDKCIGVDSITGYMCACNAIECTDWPR